MSGDEVLRVGEIGYAKVADGTNGLAVADGAARIQVHILAPSAHLFYFYRYHRNPH